MPDLPSSLLRWHAAVDPAVTFRDTIYEPQRGIVLVEGAREGSVTSPPQPVESTQAVPSWSADTPPGTWIEVWLRADISGRWTRWYSLGQWSIDAAHRKSVNGQHDDDAEVATDTLLLRQPAQTVQWRVVLHGAEDRTPALRRVAIAVGPVEAEADDGANVVPMSPLPVPELSQMVYPGGGPVWCSPTALGMVFGYWHHQTQNEPLALFVGAESIAQQIAPGVYDPVYDGTGNWPFNTAFAASVGLEAYVAQLRGLNELAMWLRAGVPVVASIQFERGTLDNTPHGFERTSGHLLVVVGVDEADDVVVNDPRADSRIGDDVRRTYKRAQFLEAWTRGGRMVYLVFPPAFIH